MTFQPIPYIRKVLLRRLFLLPHLNAPLPS
jgi:hypothetical protein